MIASEDILALGFTEVDSQRENRRAYRSVDEQYMISIFLQDDGSEMVLWFEKGEVKPGKYEFRYHRADPTYQRTTITGSRITNYETGTVHSQEDLLLHLAKRKYPVALNMLRNKKIESILE